MTDVPCNGCRACCIDEEVILSPEHGDDPDQYDSIPMPDGLHRLCHKPNGECIYLTQTGCSIHGRAPWACQQFDCRSWVMKLSFAMDPLLRPDDPRGDVLRAGQKRLEGCA